MWACLVCDKDAEFIVDTPSSKLKKNDTYSIQRRGFCKKHKPDVWTIKEYTDAMKVE
jgi:hypothetical protein